MVYICPGGNCTGIAIFFFDKVSHLKHPIGHPESFGTPMGKFVMAELEKRGLISLIVFDEVHTCNEWSGFRGDMTRLSAAMRAYAPNAPVCLMSATVTTAELQALSKALGLSPRPVLLANSPLQPHIKFSFVKRPPNAFGVEGIEEDGEVLKPGLIQMLDRQGYLFVLFLSFSGQLKIRS